jgi:ABC-type phosphate/phosphonate transport system substrate-binding protein
LTTGKKQGFSWLPPVGWLLVLAGLVWFVWGLHRRSTLEASGSQVIRMLFVPSVEQGTLVEGSDDLAEFIRRDSGLILRTEVPTSYAAVIQALGSGQADVAWMPAFAYVLAHARYGAEARLQVVRAAERFGIVVTRSGEGEPETLAELRGLSIAFPETLGGELRERMLGTLDRRAPGWIEVPAANDKEALRALVEDPFTISAAVSSYIQTGPYDLVGDGRKELEYERSGTLERTRAIFKTEEPVKDLDTVYRGCVMSRTDSGVRRLRDLNGQSFAFSDETSTSGHIFPRMLLDRAGVMLGRVYYAGGHPNVVQAVWDGKAKAGSTFFSPPNEKQRSEGLQVGDARYIIMRRLPDQAARERFLEEVRVIALTDPIPNDLCAVRKDFPSEIWRRFEESFQRYLQTEEGREVYFDLLAAVAAAATDDAAFDGFRQALQTSGISAEGLLEAAEKRLESRRNEQGS